jgi:hypothetical protein
MGKGDGAASGAGEKELKTTLIFFVGKNGGKSVEREAR